MKILMCPEYFIPSIGGGEVWSWQVAKHLVRKGNDVDILTYKHPEKPHDEKIEGVNIRRIGAFPISGVQSYFKRATIQGIGVINKGLKLDFDIIQASQTFPLLPSSFLSKMKKRPLVAVYHDIYGYSFSLKDKGLLRGVIRGSVEHITLKMNYDAIIAVSRSTMKKLLKYGIDEEKIKVITGGVDLKMIDPIKEEKTSTPSILFVGRLVPHKRVEDLLKAFSIVLKTNPKTNLYIVGTGKHKDFLQEYASSLNLEKKVTFTDYVTESEKIRLMKKAHVLVLPSIMEGFGLVLIEAMACKTPVIATDLGGPKEVVVDNETGFLVEPFNPKALAEKIGSIINDEKFRTRMGEAGRRRVEELYTWDKTADNMIQLYKKLVP